MRNWKPGENKYTILWLKFLFNFDLDLIRYNSSAKIEDIRIFSRSSIRQIHWNHYLFYLYNKKIVDRSTNIKNNWITLYVYVEEAKILDWKKGKKLSSTCSSKISHKSPILTGRLGRHLVLFESSTHARTAIKGVHKKHREKPGCSCRI